MKLKIMSTEKAVMKIESENVLTFEAGKNESKKSIREEVENLLKVKVEKVRTQVRDNKKYAYVKLNKDHLAIDIASKLGLM